jgi:ribosomal protein L10
VAIKLEDKKAIVAEVNEAAKVALSAVVADARGVTVGAMTGLRKEAREAGVYVRVVRNTLLKRAVADTEYSVLNDVFTGPTLIAFSKNIQALLPVCSKSSQKVRISSRSRQLRSRASSSQLIRSTYWQVCRPVTKQFLS